MIEEKRCNMPVTPVDFDPFACEAVVAVLPLTEPQAEMWAAVQMGDEASCAYNQCFSLTLRGPLSAESMQSALTQVVVRHEALRVSIDTEGNRQKISATSQIVLPVIDLSHHSAQSRAAEIARVLQAETSQPFDLALGPLLRATLLREAGNLHRLVVTVHHIVCDGWSSAVLFSDLGRIYAADRHGLRAQLPAASPYRDYVTREVGNAQASADQDYWAQQYAGAIPVLNLPLDRRRPATKTYNGACRNLRLDESLYRALKKAGAQHGCTLFVTLLAGFEALISRLSGQQDFVVGVPMAGQALLDNAHLVGHCVNVIPLRCQIEPAARFVAHLESVRHTFLEAQSHQQLTFGSLVRRLNVPRDPSRTPLVAATFNIDRIGAPFDFGDLALESVESPSKRFVNFDLSVNVVDTGRDLLVECEYNTDLFTPATIGRWLGHYRVLLEGIASDTGQRTDELPLLTDVERQQLLVGWSGETIDFPGQGCLHESFEAQVERAPESVAVAFEGKTLTYRELNQRANRLAHSSARERGRAGCPDRSVRGALARSGCRPLGHSQGWGRLCATRPRVSGGSLVVPTPRCGDRPNRHTAELHESVACGCRAKPSAWIAIGRTISRMSDANPRSTVRPDHLAYVIYTSGSTGKPKGVADHAPQRDPAVRRPPTPGSTSTTGDVWTLFHSYAFDFSVWELWGALLYGGRLVVVPYWVSRSPGAFHELLVREQVTVLNQTPSAFRQLIAGRTAGARRPTVRPALRDLRRRGAGAAEPAALVRAPRRRAAAAGQHVRHHRDHRACDLPTHTPGRSGIRRGSVIGIPIPDLRLYVLDPHGQPVPDRRAGEMYVGGAGVARGYLNRPSSPPSASSPIRSLPSRERGCTAPAIWRGRLANGDIEYLGPHRSPGQDPRLPHRTGRDRGCNRRASGRAGQRGCRNRGRRGRQASRRLPCDRDGAGGPYC